MPTLGPWTYSVDRIATAEAYALAPRGGADDCGCVTCRNFRLARMSVYPAEFLALLDGLGIDPAKEGEAYGCGETETGGHRYGGWFHFVGELLSERGAERVSFAPDFQTSLAPAIAPRLESLRGLRVVELNFYVGDVPWRLDEPNPG